MYADTFISIAVQCIQEHMYDEDIHTYKHTHTLTLINIHQYVHMTKVIHACIRIRNMHVYIHTSHVDSAGNSTQS
jgi:hypothetical protein